MPCGCSGDSAPTRWANNGKLEALAQVVLDARTARSRRDSGGALRPRPDGGQPAARPSGTRPHGGPAIAQDGVRIRARTRRAPVHTLREDARTSGHRSQETGTPAAIESRIDRDRARRGCPSGAKLLATRRRKPFTPVWPAHPSPARQSGPAPLSRTLPDVRLRPKSWPCVFRPAAMPATQFVPSK